MALILQIETSTTSCSVALSLDGQTLTIREQDKRNIHASYLTLFIQDVLKASGKHMQDLDAVAVSMGPGSYTGLRIGVSTAKGLCYALDIPLIAVNTLKAMVYGIKEKFREDGFLYCPMIDARRMEVYAAVYDAEFKEILPVAARIIDEHSYSALLKDKKIVFFGDGAMKCKSVLDRNENALFIADFLNSAGDLSALAFTKFNEHEFEDVAYFEPFYLKDFLATQPKKLV